MSRPAIVTIQAGKSRAGKGRLCTASASMGWCVDLHLQGSVVPGVIHSFDMEETKLAVTVDEGLCHDFSLGVELRLVVACIQAISLFGKGQQSDAGKDPVEGI